jgi:motility quorum-sensing regulator/GCU-specific mRNA interferase toxin
MEKGTPHFKLSVIKALVRARKVGTTNAARIGADALGL